MRANENELRAMASLNNDPNFIKFKEYLHRWLVEDMLELIVTEKPLIYQGRTKVLHDLTTTIDEARENASSRVAQRAVSQERRGTAF